MNEQIELSVLVLDFCKEEETRMCLASIKNNLWVPHTTILLDNGGKKDYCWKLYQDGMCDVLISKKESLGGGIGQTDLFRWCNTKYALFVQNDQYLAYCITTKEFDVFKRLLETEHCVDLNGDQSNRGVWTDRAHLIKTDFFNSLAPFPNGGPGPLHHLPWNEGYLQEVFKKNDYKIAHIKPAFFIDNGKSAVRQNPDGSVWEHFPDTKQLWLKSGPVKERYIYPYFTDEEWIKVIETQHWPDGQIPELEKKNSFHVWN